jgi:NAD(P)-dependent dehydrogenase (short-subunit alcohol dehydrogenase family)
LAHLKGRIALITGATRGLGAAVAKRYAQEGADLIVLSRDITQLEALDDCLASYGGNVTLVPYDLKNHTNLEDLARAITERYGRLDILVGNAAILGVLGPIQQVQPSLWQDVLDINLTANWYLLKFFDPLLRKSSAGRAIFVTSEVSHAVLPYWSAYSVSKAALENMVMLYAHENLNSSLRVNLVDPGNIRTSMHSEACPGIDPLSIPDPKDFIDIFVHLSTEKCKTTGQIFKAQEFKYEDVK